MDIVYIGQLEKRRDGALRGGWAVRTFILSNSILFYYRKTTPLDLLGEERGHLELKEIQSVKKSDGGIDAAPGYYYLEIDQNGRIMVLRTEDKAEQENWIKYLNNPKAEIKKQENKAEIVQKLEIVCVSVVGSTGYLSPTKTRKSNMPADWVVKKSPVPWNTSIDVGCLPQGGACLVTLSNQSTFRIGTQSLLSAWNSEKEIWIRGDSTGTEILVSATCVKRHQNEQVKPKEVKVEKLPSALDTVQKGLGALFLLFCVCLHVMQGVEDLTWIQRSSVTIGAATAILVLTRAQNKPNVQDVLEDTASPTLNYKLNIHEYRTIA